MLEPFELIAVARALALNTDPSLPSDARLRRAVSTAYYAVFHLVLRAASDRFVGVGDRAAVSYRIVYRSFDHGHMREMCLRLRSPVLTDKYKKLFEKDALDPETRSFCSAFVQLQRNRILADYDPEFSLPPSEAFSVIDSAEAAMTTFARIAPRERTDLLALLMAPART